MYILIIDDNEELLYALEQLLKDTNYHVDVAKTLHDGEYTISQKNTI